MATQGALAEVWPEAVEHLKPALERARGTHTIDEIFAGVMRGELQLWVGNHSAGITEVVTYPRCKAVRIFLAGGDLEEMKHMERVLSEGARELGFDRIEIGGRRGFLRALVGYEELCTYVMKEL